MAGVGLATDDARGFWIPRVLEVNDLLHLAVQRRTYGSVRNFFRRPQKSLRKIKPAYFRSVMSLKKTFSFYLHEINKFF